MVYDPPALYDFLEDSSGGIAEWIIPSVFAGHVDVVWWIRPCFATQIDDGDHQFLVGGVEPSAHELAEEDQESEAVAPATGTMPTPVSTRSGYRGPDSLQPHLERARLRVSSDARYYVDDPWCIAPSSRMVVKAPLRLLVSTVGDDDEQTEDACTQGSGGSGGGSGNGAGGAGYHEEAIREQCYARAVSGAKGSWVLDICLDYFGTHNPFARLVGPSPTGVALAAALAAAAVAPAFRQPGAEERMDLETRMDHARRLERGLVSMLRKRWPQEYGDLEDEAAAAVTPVVRSIGVSAELCELYESFEVGRAVLCRLRDAAGKATKQEVSAAMDMVPCATLPDSPCSNAEVDASLNQLRRSLTSGRLARCGRPGLITIARSAMDPYTPPGRVDRLQDQVIKLMADVYGHVDVEFDLDLNEYDGRVMQGTNGPRKRDVECDAHPMTQPMTHEASKRPRRT